MSARESLKQYLSDNGVTFEEHHHSVAYTAQDVANAEHTPGHIVAKVTIARADGELVMLVLPASKRVDFAKINNILGRESRWQRNPSLRVCLLIAKPAPCHPSVIFMG